jgi:hypothetical protein
MTRLLAGLAANDRDEQLGEEVVTLPTVEERQLVPEESVGKGQRTLRREGTRRILVHNSLLLVAMHKK